MIVLEIIGWIILAIIGLIILLMLYIAAIYLKSKAQMRAWMEEFDNFLRNKFISKKHEKSK
jgi:hypothetical protein